MALMNRPTDDPKVSRWWWRALRTWVYSLVDPLWEAFRGENSDDIALTNVTTINGVSATEIAVLDGLAATTAELNKLSGLTAEATELNKSDRTAADGVAEASKNVVLDADKDILGKRYDINQSLLAAIAGQPHMHFNGSNSKVTVPDDPNIDFGTGDFTVICRFAVWSTSSNNAGLLNKGDLHSARDNAGWVLKCRADQGGGIMFQYKSTAEGTFGPSEAGSGYSDGCIHVVAAIVDRDGNLFIYIDGVQIYSASNTVTGSVSSASDLEMGIQHYNNVDGSFVAGAIYQVRLFNRALTTAEVKSYTSGAPLLFADVGASQSDLIVNGDDWTGATGSTPPNSWSDSGSATVTYIIRDNTGVANMDDKVLEMDVSGSGSKTLSQGVFQIGKRYLVTFAYRNLDGSGGATKVTFGSSGNSATLQNTTISGDGVIFTQEVLADGSDLAFEVTTAGALQVDGVQVVQIGCVLAFRPTGIGQSQWQDASGNQLHGTVTGAQPYQLPANHVERYVRKGITADTTLTGVVPAGYRTRSIIVEETAGNAITGGLKIGTSAGGTEVVNAQAVGANALVDCALGTRLFSLTADQTLYVEDVTAWNGASIDLYLEMERIK